MELAFVLLPIPLMLWWASRLIKWGLHRQYRILTGYLLWSGVVTLIAVALQVADLRSAYRTVFFIYRPSDWALGTAALLELFRITAAVSPALEKAGRWFANGATALTLLVGVGLAAAGSAGKIGNERWIALERSYYVSVIALSVLLLAFVAVFRVRERRNVVVIAVSLAVLLGGSGVIWFLTPAQPSMWYLVVGNVILLASLAGGLICTKPSGEDLPRQAVSQEARDMEGELIKRIEQTTDKLTRDAKEGLEDPPPGD